MPTTLKERGCARSYTPRVVEQLARLHAQVTSGAGTGGVLIARSSNPIRSKLLAERLTCTQRALRSRLSADQLMDCKWLRHRHRVTGRENCAPLNMFLSIRVSDRKCATYRNFEHWPCAYHADTQRLCDRAHGATMRSDCSSYPHGTS